MREFLRRLMRPRPANDAEALADRWIAWAKYCGVKDPRFAAEMCAGREFTDAEWGRVEAVWNRRWY